MQKKNDLQIQKGFKKYICKLDSIVFIPFSQVSIFYGLLFVFSTLYKSAHSQKQ